MCHPSPEWAGAVVLYPTVLEEVAVGLSNAIVGESRHEILRLTARTVEDNSNWKRREAARTA